MTSPITPGLKSDLLHGWKNGQRGLFILFGCVIAVMVAAIIAIAIMLTLSITDENHLAPYALTEQGFFSLVTDPVVLDGSGLFDYGSLICFAANLDGESVQVRFELTWRQSAGRGVTEASLAQFVAEGPVDPPCSISPNMIRLPIPDGLFAGDGWIVESKLRPLDENQNPISGITYFHTSEMFSVMEE